MPHQRNKTEEREKQSAHKQTNNLFSSKSITFRNIHFTRYALYNRNNKYKSVSTARSFSLHHTLVHHFKPFFRRCRMCVCILLTVFYSIGIPLATVLHTLCTLCVLTHSLFGLHIQLLARSLSLKYIVPLHGLHPAPLSLSSPSASSTSHCSSRYCARHLTNLLKTGKIY